MIFRDPFDSPPELEAAPGSEIERAIRACLPEPLASAPSLRGVVISMPASRPSLVAGSKVGPPCGRCGSRVWLSPSTQRYPHPIPAVVCSDCLTRALARLEIKA